MRVALALTAMLLAACGSDDGDRLSRDELVDRANEICSEHVGAIDRLRAGIGGGEESDKSLAEFARVLPEIADRFRQLADDLGELDAPEDIEDEFELTLARINRVADELDQAAELAEEGDRTAFNAALRESPAATSVQQFFRENGFRECD
jgi:acyl-CoA reductase-like NAD-dependent aldehyde dehydrogenase